MKYSLLFIVLFFLVVSCSKSDPIDEIKYEVRVINAEMWHGAYLNENAEMVGVDNGNSVWTYSFKNSKKLIVAMLQAYPNGTNSGADCILKIYVNGTVVASTKTSIWPQLRYEFP